MTEEEKEAIKFIIFYKTYCLNKEKTNIKNYETINDEDFVSKNIEIVLNLIEKQQNTIKGNECVIETLSHNEEVLLEVLEKKDKTIDKMAKWIFDKDYVENSLLIHRDDYYSNCIKQVIEYFEKKEE